MWYAIEKGAMNMTNKQLTWRQRGELWLRLGLRLVLTALAVWLLARFGRRTLSLFAPFLFALVAAVLLNQIGRASCRERV